MTKPLTLVQEVYFDICDAIENGDLYDYEIQGFSEFATVLEFLEEQKRKLAEIELSLDLKQSKELHQPARTWWKF